MATEIFIFGIARSGTNLIARLLDAHSKIGVTLDPFLPILNNWLQDTALQSENIEVQSQYGHPGPIPDYYFNPAGRLMRELLEVEASQTTIPCDKKQMLVDLLVQRTALETPETAARLHGIEENTYSRFIQEVLKSLRHVHGNNISCVGIKEVWTVEFIPVLARLFPKSKFIVVQRDPRAIISSLLKMGEIDDTQLAHTVSYARQWRKNFTLSEEYSNRKNLSGRLVKIYYENVTQTPQSFCREMSNWLELEYENSMLDISKSGWAGNSSFGDMNGVSTRSQNQWRSELDADSLAMVEYICAAEMRLENYNLIGDGTLTQSAMRHIMWADQNPGSWRGDSDDTYGFLAWEELRQRLINAPMNIELDLIERLFLSKETYRTFQSAN